MVRSVRVVAFAAPITALRFANMYGDGMVLASRPQRATVWGFATADTSVQVCLGGKCVQAEVTGAGDDATFFAALPAVKPSSTPWTITASSSGSVAALKGVLFGSVFVCGGQSNMDMVASMAFNGTSEALDADNYPSIRVFTVGKGNSKSVSREIDYVGQEWAPASKATIGGPSYWDSQNFSDWENHIGSVTGGEGFSAVCWFFGRELFKKTQQPVGLIWASHGGSRVETWMEGQDVSTCGGKNKDGGHWNTMIRPLLGTVISGTVWYQGESNADSPAKYSCTFPAMIQSWRKRWFEGTKGNTLPSWPFGFVQLSTHGGDVQGYGLGLDTPGYAALRWAQTATYGFAPNPALPNVFMATAVDIGQRSSPAKGPHVQNKQEVGRRLALAYRRTLGEKRIYTPGPIAKSAIIEDGELHVTFENLSPAGLGPLSTLLGVELSSGDDFWTSAPAAKLVDGGQAVAISTPPEMPSPTRVRYLWAQNPCLPVPGSECPLRGADIHKLPALPFVINITENIAIVA